MTSLTPCSESELPIVLNILPNEDDPPLGYEPEGSSTCEDYETKPPRWPNNLQALLNNKNDLKNFQRYLEETDLNHFHMLRFLFACKGLSDESVESAQILIKIIFTRFITGDMKFTIEDELRDAVVEQYSKASASGVFLPRDIFDRMCTRIEQIINDEMYPKFLTHQTQKLQNTGHDCKKHFFEQLQRGYRGTYYRYPTDSQLREQAKKQEPNTLAKDLMQRLEKVKKEEECAEIETNEQKNPDEMNTLKKILARVISQKVDEDSEEILDQHIDRVWTDVVQNDASNTCPTVKYRDSEKYDVPHPYAGVGTTRRKVRDMYSIFSEDSGFATGYYSDSNSKISNYETIDRYQRKSKAWNSRSTLTDSAISEEDQYLQYNRKMYERRDPKNRTGDGCQYSWYDCRKNFAKDYSDSDEIPLLPKNSFHSIDSYAQVEEKRRRSLLNEMRQKLKSPSWNGGSNGTCQKTKSETECTTVVYNFSDEKMPYRVRVPGAPITLKKFKQFMPRKGNFRYFFITQCQDFGMEVVQEEITDDSQVLPLWEGRVDARIKLVK